MLSLEHFARVRAAIEKNGDRDAGLSEANIAPAEWIKLQRHWLGELATEVARGEDALAARYLRAFEGKPADEPRAPAPAVRPLDLPPSSPANDESDARISSFETPVMPPAPIASPPRSPARTVATVAFTAPSGPATPFLEGAVSAPPKPRSEPGPRASTGTAHIPDEARGPSLPFPAQTPSAKTPDAASRPAHPGSGTAFAPEAPSGPATPFSKPEPDTLGFPLVRYAALVAARQAPGADPSEVLARFAIDEATHQRVEAIWQKRFAEQGLLALDFERYLGEAKKALTVKKQKPLATGTAISLDVPRAPPPPAPAQGEAPPVREMTLDQYAFVAAAIRKALPADVPAVLDRFRLTAASRKDLEERWSQRMSADPGLRQAFIAALAKHLGGGG